MLHPLPLCALAALVALTGCATVPPGEGHEAVAPLGTSVRLGQPISLGAVEVTPLRIVEDSRCPENARCMEPGKLTVEARIQGPGWLDTVPLTLGESHLTHGSVIGLASAVPGRQANRPLPLEDYRFGFEQFRQLPVARLGERVQVDGPAVTPREVLEDSRCPSDVQCVWAGRLRLRATIHLGSGDEDHVLLLGEQVQVADGALELAEAWPEPVVGGAITPADYRFAFRFDGGY